MIRKLIIHLGGFKTGSTALQRTLFAKRAELGLAGIHYPGFASNHGLALLPNLISMANKIARHPYGGIWRGALAKEVNEEIDTAFAQAISSNTHELTILSGEHFSTLSHVAVASFVSRLRNHFDEIEALIYLRAPEEFATSMAQQLVRDGMMLADVIKTPPAPQYRMILTPWDQVLGADAVTVRPYSRDTEIISDFCAAIGRPDVAPMLRAQAKSGKVNSSFSANAIAALDQVNKVLPNGLFNPLRPMQITRFAAKNTEGTFALPPTCLDMVQDACSKDIEWLAQRAPNVVFANPAKSSSREFTSTPEVSTETANNLIERANAEQDRIALRAFSLGVSSANPRLVRAAIPMFRNASSAKQAAGTLIAQGSERYAREVAAQAKSLAPHDVEITMLLGQLTAQSSECKEA